MASGSGPSFFEKMFGTGQVPEPIALAYAGGAAPHLKPHVGLHRRKGFHKLKTHHAQNGHHHPQGNKHPHHPHTQHGHGAARMKVGQAAHIAEERYSPADVHNALHMAGAKMGVSSDLLGGFAYLESRGGNPYAHDGRSQGLLQIQKPTADSIIGYDSGKYGHVIGAALKETGNPKYAGLVKGLEKNPPSFGPDYMKNIHDPYFNALLGAGLTRINAEGLGIGEAALKNLDLKTPQGLHAATVLYSDHLFGRAIDPAKHDPHAPLTSISGITQEHINANVGILNKNSHPTVQQAFGALQGNLRVWADRFRTADNGIHMQQEGRLAEQNQQEAHLVQQKKYGDNQMLNGMPPMEQTADVKPSPNMSRFTGGASLQMPRQTFGLSGPLGPSV